MKSIQLLWSDQNLNSVAMTSYEIGSWTIKKRDNIIADTSNERSSNCLLLKN